MRRSFLAAALLPAILFPAAALLIGLRNPSIFDTLAISKTIPLFSAIFILLVFQAAWGVLGKSAWAYENLSGTILFFFFTIGYFLLASIFNKSEINTNNIYFAADSWSWYQRMAPAEGWNTGVRAVHPLAHIIFRPAVALISILTYGNRFYANLALLALAGGGCVILMWKIVREISNDGVYAVLAASLLGVSASHLIFASVIESYVFSAFFLLLFIWLLLNDKPTYMLIATGVLTFGITLTNIVQQALTAMLIQRNLKRIVLLFSAVILIAVALNVISRFIYPVTEYFFLPQNLAGEQRFAQEITLKRLGLMTENLLIYNVVAPQPYSSLRNDMPRFNFLNGTIREYAWFGWPAVLLWVAVLSLALFLFFRSIPSSRNERFLSVSLLACLAFNFLLHIGYGIEPFLYSADWTYALILFIAIALKGFAERMWFKAALLIMVMSILVNNLWLLYLIARNVSELLV